MNTVKAGKRIALKDILFATDFSPCSYAALPYAVSLARKYGATLHAAHVMPTAADMVLMSPDNWPTVANEIELQTNQLVMELEDNLQGVAHRVLTPTGKIPDALVEIITGSEIDLVVLGTHGRTGIRKLAMGSFAEEIFRCARCPVLSVGPHLSQEPDREAKFHHILYATDFSPESLAAAPYAISLAEEDEAQLALLHVIGQPAAGVVNPRAVTASLERRLKQLVPPDSEPWCHLQYLIEFDEQFASPAGAILKAAEHNATDLIVLGVRSVYGKLAMVTHLANTTTHILAHARCPVLTVRAESA